MCKPDLRHDSSQPPSRCFAIRERQLFSPQFVMVFPSRHKLFKSCLLRDANRRTNWKSFSVWTWLIHWRSPIGALAFGPRYRWCDISQFTIRPTTKMTQMAITFAVVDFDDGLSTPRDLRKRGQIMSAEFITTRANKHMLPKSAAEVPGGNVTPTIPHPTSVPKLTRITL
jgi:hypothetical protein